MKVSQISPVTGKMNTMELDITLKQLADWTNGGLIQDVMPNLSEDEREFLISGCTPEDWKAIFQSDCNIQILRRAHLK